MKTRNLLFLSLLMAAFSINAQDCNIGIETTNSDFIDGSFQPDYILGIKHTLSEIGTLNSINLLGNATGDMVQMAVYNDNGGVPNDLMASTILSEVTSGVVSLSVPPTALPAGDYWIMAIYQNGGSPSDYSLSNLDNVVYYNPLSFGDPLPPNASSFLTYTGQDFLYFLDITCGTVSIDENVAGSEVKVYPSPASTNIQVSGLGKDEKYTITNALGKIMFEGTANSEDDIEIASLINGLYLIRFENGNTLRFVKE